MKINLKRIPIKKIVKNYTDNGNDGVFGLNGKLDIRPPYQREFVYKSEQQLSVIDSIKKNFPLNVMYWFVRDDGSFEVIDGQQRTISICRYINNGFSFKGMYFNNLQQDEQEKILNYELMIYQCIGTTTERLNWFEKINIAGEPLKPQEIKNATFSGPWVTDAKRRFSKNGCVAYNIASDYLTGTANRQDYLETAIKWKSCNNIKDYMGIHQRDENAEELWKYFTDVVDWIEKTFTTKRPEMMDGTEWGFLYNKYKNEKFDAKKIEKRTKKLVEDYDVTKNKGIYTYILTGEEKHLSIRTFSRNEKQKAYEKQKGKCNHCTEEFEFSEMEGDHIKPWSKGGKTIPENCQILCKECNGSKSNK